MARSRAAEVIVAGQLVTVEGTRQDVAAICKPRTLSADDGMREFRTVDGEVVNFNIGAVALIRDAAAVKATGAFGFSRALEEVA